MKGAWTYQQIKRNFLVPSPFFLFATKMKFESNWCCTRAFNNRLIRLMCVLQKSFRDFVVGLPLAAHRRTRTQQRREIKTHAIPPPETSTLTIRLLLQPAQVQHWTLRGPALSDSRARFPYLWISTRNMCAFRLGPDVNWKGVAIPRPITNDDGWTCPLVQDIIKNVPRRRGNNGVSPPSTAGNLFVM